MGSGRWDATSYATYASATATMPRSTRFSTRGKATARLSPKNVNMRESRDSNDNPNSTAIIVAVDVTGSMGVLAEAIARQGLGTLFEQIIARRSVPDPHMMFMAIGDINSDQEPLQVSQFEADNRIVEQLTEIFLEGGGGGNNFESYNLPWYFAHMHTSIDCFEQRGKKGYLFTIGDESVPNNLTESQLRGLMGDLPVQAMSNEDLLAKVKEKYEVFHIIACEGSFARGNMALLRDKWRALMEPQHVIEMSDHTKLAEIIVSTIQVVEGEDSAKVAGSWGGDTAVVVANATRTLRARGAGTVTVAGTGGPVRL